MMLHVNNDKFIKSEIDYNKIFEKKKAYDFIYVSIGSRIFREEDSNAYYQMFPNFLLSIEKVLIVIIDNFFDTPDELNSNAILTYKKTHDKTDIFLINNLFTPNQFIQIYESLFFHLSGVELSKYIIANYIRFKRTEPDDDTKYLKSCDELEKLQPELFQEPVFYSCYKNKLMSFLTNSDFSHFWKNIYFWTGFNLEYLKNIIYSFEFYKNNKQFESIYRMNINTNYLILKNIIMNNLKKAAYLDPEKIKEIYERLKETATQNSKFLKVANTFIYFCKNAIDITWEHKDNLHLMREDMLPIDIEQDSILKGGWRKKPSTIKKPRKYKIKSLRKTNYKKN